MKNADSPLGEGIRLFPSAFRLPPSSLFFPRASKATRAAAAGVEISDNVEPDLHHGTITSCARRSMGFSTNGVLPRFQVETKIWP